MSAGPEPEPGLSARFGMAMEVAAERRCNRTGFSVPDRPAVDLDHRQDDLARRGDERLPRRMRLLQRERPDVGLEPLRGDDVQHDSAGDAAQDAVIELPG